MKNRLYTLAQANILDSTALKRAIDIAGYTPSQDRWIKFIDWLLLALGTGLFFTGAFIFSGKNWSGINGVVKLGIIAIGIFLCVGYGFKVGTHRISAKFALMSATFLVGAFQLVAVTEYHLDGEFYQFFLIWAASTIWWVTTSRWAFLWLVWLAILDTFIISLLVSLNADAWESIYIFIIILFGTQLTFWEYFATNGIQWLQARWIPRLIASIIIAIATYYMFLWIVEGFGDQFTGFEQYAPLTYGITIGIISTIYIRTQLDLFMLTMCALSFVVISNLIFGRFTIDAVDPVLTLFFMTLIVLLELAFLVNWLMSLHKRSEII